MQEGHCIVQSCHVLGLRIINKSTKYATTPHHTYGNMSEGCCCCCFLFVFYFIFSFIFDFLKDFIGTEFYIACLGQLSLIFLSDNTNRHIKNISLWEIQSHILSLHPITQSLGSFEAIFRVKALDLHSWKHI